MYFVIVTLAICQICTAFPSSSNDSEPWAPTNSNGNKYFKYYWHYSCSFSDCNIRFSGTQNVVLCGNLTCPATTNTCTVTKKSTTDLTQIIITYDCKQGEDVLLSDTYAKDNKYNVSVNSIASISVGQPTEKDAQIARDNIQAGLDFSRQIQEYIRASFANVFFPTAFGFF